MGVIARYRDRLPVGPETPALTLGEGSTPLIPARRLGERYEFRPQQLEMAASVEKALGEGHHRIKTELP